MKRLAFKIGDLVEVRAVVEKRWSSDDPKTLDDKKNLKTYVAVECEPFEAVITGATIRSEGERIEGSGPTNEDGDFDPPYLAVSKVHPLFLVRRGITNKEMMVFEGDVRPMGPHCIYIMEDPLEFPKKSVLGWLVTVMKSPVPSRYLVPAPMDDRYRKDMRDFARDMSRDKKGRWTK